MSIEPIEINVFEDVQENYIVYDREITQNQDPPFNSNILVTNDNKSNRLWFNMYYTFDDVVLDDEGKEISIVWVNADNEKGFSLAQNISVIQAEHRLTFAWDVPVQATHKEGIVYFAVRITSLLTETTGEPTYVWNSLAGSVAVKKGLVTDEFNKLDDASYPPGWVDYIEGKYKIALNKISQSDYQDLTIKDSYTLYLVEDTGGNITQYLGDVPISGGGSPVPPSPTPTSEGDVILSSGIISATHNPPVDFTYISSSGVHTATIYTGLTYRCPDGLNADGTRKYIDVTLDTDITNVVLASPGRKYLFIMSDKTTMNEAQRFIINNDSNYDNMGIPTLKYDIITNTIKYYNAQGQSYIVSGVILGYVTNISELGYKAGKSNTYSVANTFNTDIINDLIANKPGKSLNDAVPYYTKGSELMGIFKATNCVAFNDEETHIVTGNNNTALGKSQEIYTGNNNMVCGESNKLQLIQPSAQIPENNIINGYQNIINANIIKDNIINGSSNTINFASGYDSDTPVRTGGTVQNSIISGNINTLYTELDNSVMSGWNNTIFNDSATSTVYPTARCMICGESNKIAKANNSIISGYNNIVKNPRNSIISGKDSNIGNSTNNVDSSVIVTDDSDLSNTSVNGSLIVGTGLTANTLETGTTVLGKFNTDTTDKIFVIGNGSSSSNRKNAMEVDKNNNLTVAGTINITDNSVNPVIVIDLLAKIKELENRISELEQRT